MTIEHIGNCAWSGTIAELLRMDRGGFMAAMKSSNSQITDFDVESPQCKAWRDEFKCLRVQLAKLGGEYQRLHIAFEYVLPGWEDKETGEVTYEKRPDVIIFSASQVLVLEFKQHEPPPYDGFAKQARGYLRLLEHWHPHVPRMSAKGALILTHAADFGKKYPRVRAVSPDRLPSVIRRTFAGSLLPCPDPSTWLDSISRNL